MSLTSSMFVLMFGLSLIIYYVLPGKFQWTGLLTFSTIFFTLSSAPSTWVYIIVSILTTTLCVNRIAQANVAGQPQIARRFLITGIIINVGILGVLNYSNFIISNINIISSWLNAPIKIQKVNWLTPIGLSFYTMQILGYMLDTYWGIVTPAKGFLKNALFIGYYPLLTSGPIVRYHQVADQLYASHKGNYQNITFGMQRILWGFFKKLVISGRCGTIVDTIYGDPTTYSGLYIWFASILFMMQLYTDFSGCMDIIIGASECYGIRLPENFRTPFFSRSVQEYWQRWHISLGAWLKDYILYPVLRSNAWRSLSKWLKKHVGKKASKEIPTYLGMLCVWLLIGLWHGGKWKYIIGMGLWFWMLITLSQVLAPVSKKIIACLYINTDCFSWRLFQSLRVFVLVCIGNMFFRLDGLIDTLKTIQLGLSTWNPWIFFDGSLFNLGLDRMDFVVTLIALSILLLVSSLQEKGSVRTMLSRQNLVFRWLVLYALIFAVIIFGQYGIGYDAQEFIYMQF